MSGDDEVADAEVRRTLARLVADGVAAIDGDLVAIGDRWAIHGVIAYDGEVLLAEFDSLEHARAVLTRTPRSDRPRRDVAPISALLKGPLMSTSASHRSTKPPVMFIHGLWLHSSSWLPWIEAFEEAGYEASAPGWPDEADTVEAARAEPDAQAGHGIDDVVDHYTELVAALERPPVLIGHSFGGTIVERLLGGGVGAAGIAIDAAPIKGVLPVPISALRSAFPVLKRPSNAHKTVSLTAEQFRYAFGNAVPADESDELWQRWNIPAPGRPIFQSATANFSPHSESKVDTHNDSRGPLLLVAGGNDHTVPETITESTLKQYKHTTATTDLIAFPDRGHSLVIDHGWREIADACIAWLDGQQL